MSINFPDDNPEQIARATSPVVAYDHAPEIGQSATFTMPGNTSKSLADALTVAVDNKAAAVTIINHGNKDLHIKQDGTDAALTDGHIDSNGASIKLHGNKANLDKIRLFIPNPGGDISVFVSVKATQS